MINSLIISVFRYCAPLLVDARCDMIAKLQTLLMKCTCVVLGFKSYKMSTIQIMNELNSTTIPLLIIKETVLFVHKISFSEKPEVIFGLFTYSRANNENIRSIRKPMVVDHPINCKVSQSLFIGLFTCIIALTMN